MYRPITELRWTFHAVVSRAAARQPSLSTRSFGRVVFTAWSMPLNRPHPRYTEGYL